MHGHGLVFAESGELRFGLFLDPVFHRSFLGTKIRISEQKAKRILSFFEREYFRAFSSEIRISEEKDKRFLRFFEREYFRAFSSKIRISKEKPNL